MAVVIYSLTTLLALIIAARMGYKYRRNELDTTASFRRTWGLFSILAPFVAFLLIRQAVLADSALKLLALGFGLAIFASVALQPLFERCKTLRRRMSRGEYVPRRWKTFRENISRCVSVVGFALFAYATFAGHQSTTHELWTVDVQGNLPTFGALICH